MKIKLKSQNFGKYQFADKQALVDLWCQHYYPNKVVLAIFDSSTAFDLIPYFNVLKRDDFKVFVVGLASEFVFMEFESAEKAYDFIQSFNDKCKIRWVVYKNGKAHAKSNYNNYNVDSTKSGG